MEKPREILIHQSANRPHLLLGGDRELVLFAALMSAMLMFALVTWWGIAAGIALWIAAVGGFLGIGGFRPVVRAGYHPPPEDLAFFSAEGAKSRREARTPARGGGSNR